MNSPNTNGVWIIMDESPATFSILGVPTVGDPVVVVYDDKKPSWTGEASRSHGEHKDTSKQINAPEDGASFIFSSSI